MHYCDVVLLTQAEAEVRLRKILDSIGVPGVIDGIPTARRVLSDLAKQPGVEHRFAGAIFIQLNWET